VLLLAEAIHPHLKQMFLVPQAEVDAMNTTVWSDVFPMSLPGRRR
jgi:hypothetical protein